MILETRHLRLVAAVAEHGTLTQAARELSLTQSALSHQLLTLEGRLGAPLFHRLGKRMVPTAVGARLITAAGDALPRLRAAEEDLLRIAAGRQAALRITTQCYTCYHWLPTLLESYRKRFPRVEVQIVVEATLHPFEALLSGQVDLAVVQEERDDDRLIRVPLFRDEIVAVLRRDHPLAAGSFLTPEQFESEHLIIYNDPIKGLSPKSWSAVQLTEGIIEMVKAGAGISVMARWAVAPYLGDVIVSRPINRRGFHRQWSAAMIRQDPLPAYLTEFVKLLAAGPQSCELAIVRPAAARARTA